MIMILVFLSMLSFLISLTGAYGDPSYIYHICSNEVNFTRNSTYQSNLHLLLSALRSNATHGSNDKFSVGFYNATAGHHPDKVYGLFLCRGDVTTETCQDCVNFATSDITRRCPVQKDTVIWYDECLLRYSSISFFSTMNEAPEVSLLDTQNSTGRLFDQKVWNLMIEAVNQALGTAKMFGTAKKNFTVFQTLYGLVQCTPDLSTDDCSRCLRLAISDLDECCSIKRGGRVLSPSCNIRYELYPFYNDTLIASPTPAPAQSPSPVLLAPPSPGSVTSSNFILNFRN